MNIVEYHSQFLRENLLPNNDRLGKMYYNMCASQLVDGGFSINSEKLKLQLNEITEVINIHNDGISAQLSSIIVPPNSFENTYISNVRFSICK